ncbi:MAG: hypothetical protein CSB49_06255 [Proteobacteria bacterium]|nr:MAG: hypothetical protein CSB49_06255 [Pseudomonadota bacterium]
MRRALTTISTLTLSVAFSVSASAYNLRLAPDGQVLIWNTRKVRVDLDARKVPGAPGATEAVRAAFGSWAAAGAPVSVLMTTTNAPKSGDQDGVNTIRFEHDSWPHGEAVVGLTLATYYVDSGLVFETDMVLDAVNRRWSTSKNTPKSAFDVRNVVTHEAGHFFGIGHSANARATMFAHSSEGEQDKQTLEADDLAALAAVVEEMDRRLGASAAPAPPPSQTSEIKRQAYTPLPERMRFGCSVAGGELGGSDLAGLITLAPLALVALLRRRRWVRFLPPLAALLAIALVLSSDAEATIVRALPITQLFRRADVALQATVVAKQSKRVDTLIVTDYTLSPSRCWRGRCERRTLRVLGGEVGNTGMYVSGMSTLRIGQELIVLAREQGKSKLLRPIGLAQSCFLIDVNKANAATRDLRRLTLLGAKGKLHHGVRQTIALPTLRLLLKAHLGRPHPPMQTPQLR